MRWLFENTAKRTTLSSRETGHFAIPAARAAIATTTDHFDLFNLQVNLRILLVEEGRMVEASHAGAAAIAAAARHDSTAPKQQPMAGGILRDFFYGRDPEQHLGFVARTRRLPRGLKDAAFADGFAGPDARAALRRACRRRLPMAGDPPSVSQWTWAFQGTDDDELLLECFLPLFFEDGDLGPVH